MTNTVILINTALAVLATVVLIIRMRVHPVIALLLGSIYLGLTSGLGVEATVDAIGTGFGDLMAEIGLLVSFGVLTGAVLQQAGALQRLVSALVSKVGPRKLPYALSMTAGTVLQSIFMDVIVVIIAPLARRLGDRSGKNGVPRLIGALAVGMYVGLVTVVPGTVVIAMSGALNVPLGRSLLYGLLVAVPTILVTITILEFAYRRGGWDAEKDQTAQVSDTDHADAEPSSADPADSGATDSSSGTGVAPQGSSRTPGTVTTPVAAPVAQTSLPLMFAPIVTALLLVATNAVLEIVGWSVPVLEFLGSPVIALLFALIGTILITRRAMGREQTGEALTRGFADSGQILILNGVGGSLAAVIAGVGLGDILGNYFSASFAVPLLLVWVIAAVLHLAIGSVLVSAITAAGILAPVADTIGLNPVWLVFAAGAGSLFAIHVTSNVFWLFQTMGGLTTRGTLKLITGGVSLASVVALIVIVPLAALLG